MSTPPNGKSATSPQRATGSTSRPLTNGTTARVTAGAGKTPTTPTNATKKPASTPLATRTGATATAARSTTASAPRTASVASRPVRDTTASAPRTASAVSRPIRDTTAPRSTGKNASRRQQEARQEQIRKLAPLFAVLGIVLVAVLIFAVLSNNGTSAVGTATVNQVVSQVTNVKPSVYESVKTGGVKNPMVNVPNVPVNVDGKGLPIILYIGGQFCPYCAAQRWSIATALSRFGTFKGIGLIQSSEDSISTLDFSNATYTSQYIDAQLVEAYGQSQGQTLKPLTDAQNKILTTYDVPPYTNNSGGGSGGIPFMSYGNQFLTISSGYDPTTISGMQWTDISGALSDPNNATTNNIIGNANYMTAAICTLTKGQPGSVCGTQTIQDIEKTIKG